ncbi:MAG: hypothetical protein ACK55I_36630 [bacterium]
MLHHVQEPPDRIVHIQRPARGSGTCARPCSALDQQDAEEALHHVGHGVLSRELTLHQGDECAGLLQLCAGQGDGTGSLRQREQLCPGRMALPQQGFRGEHHHITGQVG